MGLDPCYKQGSAVGLPVYALMINKEDENGKKRYRRESLSFQQGAVCRCCELRHLWRKVVLPEHLVEVDSVQAMVKTKDGREPELTQKLRDLLRQVSLYATDTCNYILVGIEIQTDLHYAMPTRNMLYDALSYDRQLQNIAKAHADKGDRLEKAEKTSGFAKTDTLKPVVTIVVYWSAGSWTAARSLHEMFPKNIPEEILAISADYRLNLVVPSEIENYELFRTGVRAVLKAMEASDSKKNLRTLLENDPEYQKIDRESAVAISVLADIDVQIPDEKEVNMCTAVKEWREELLEEGRNKGIIEGRDVGRKEGIIEGHREGLVQGEKKLGSLITLMLENNSDASAIARVSSDPEYRETMYLKFNIQ